MRQLDGVLLTHAHIDHSGWLPVLCRAGYRGPIWCTPGTADLAAVLLRDAAHLQEEAARFANERGFSRHQPALPLFTAEDATTAIGLLRPVPCATDFQPGAGVTARFRRAGHIVGAARVELTHADGRVIFSGDVGRANDALLLPPDPLDAPADWLVVESTYGGRRHDLADPGAMLAALLAPPLDRGAVVMVPCFAVGRAQELLHYLNVLFTDGRLPRVPVYLDSPMAIEATRIYCSHVEDHRLDQAASDALCATGEALHTQEQSRRLNEKQGPFIVLAGSGMAAGGRILHHLAQHAGNPNNAILFAGFQAAGTRGQQILEGADEVKIHGSYVRIRAERLRIDSLSAHADQAELLAWLSTLPKPPRRCFINHGEPAGADALRSRLRDTLGWDCVIPGHGESVDLA